VETEGAQNCLARGRAYDLLACGLKDGLREERLEHFRAVPALATHIPPTPNLDQWAAAHHGALTMEVPPYESAFLSATGQLDEGDAVREAYAQGGFGTVPHDLQPDHISVELAYMCWLSGAEADAEKDELPDAVTQIQDLQRDFLDGHLLRWTGALVTALQTSPQAHAFFVDLALLAHELGSTHRAHLGGDAPSWALPPSPDVLGNPETGLRDLATHLTTPSLAGGVLTRGALAQVGRAAQAPRGFGSRALMLTNLFKTASEYDRLPSVVAGLGEVVSGWTQAHTRLSAPVWAARSQATEALLTQMSRVIALKE